MNQNDANMNQSGKVQKFKVPLTAADLARLKQEKKAKKEAQKKISQANQKPQLPPPKALSRCFRAVPERRPIANVLGTITVMSFNILAQCLVKRHLFPDSQEMLKWKTRRSMIEQEISLYKPDIMCLQEVDQYETFYKDMLAKLGYQTEYCKHARKQHGCVIAYSTKVFQMVGYNTIDYDTDTTCPPTWITGNIAQFMSLRHVQHPQFGVVIGNTHMYWRPAAVYERLRQSVIYIKTLCDFKKKMEKQCPDTQWVPMPIGDFNTSPEDPGHAAMTRVALSDDELQALERSRLEPGSYIQDAEKSTDAEADEAPAETEMLSQENTMPVPDLLDILRREAQTWRSVYGCYSKIDPDTADRASGEPKFTNYAHAFKGTLDYILYPDSEEHIAPIELLEMPPESSLMPSLPNRNFGSDHVCLLAKFEYGHK